MRIRLAVLAMLGVPAAVGAQSTRTRLPATPRVHIETWTTEQGLPSQAVGNITQDRRGFIWGTLGGFVARIDDGGVTVLDESDGLPASAVRFVHVQAGRGDTLWLLDEQRAIYARVGTTVHRLPDSASSGAFSDTARMVSASGGRRFEARRLGSGTLLVDAAGNRIGVWPQVTLPPPGTSDAGTTSRDVVAVDAAGWLWVADRDGYRAFLPDVATPMAFVPAVVEPSRVSALIGSSGCLWLADVAVRRVCTVPFRTFTTRLRTGDLFSPGPNGSVIVWDSGGMPVSLDGDGGATALTPRTVPFRFARGYRSAHGDLWWSVSPNAPPSAERQVPASYRLLPHRGVRRLQYRADARGTSSAARDTVWYAVGDSLYRVVLPVRGPAQLLESRDAGGLVTDLQIDATGTVWVTLRNRALRGELLILRNGVETRVGVAEGLPDAAFRVVRPDDADGAWIGTYGSGLVHYAAGRVRRVTVADGLGEDVVTSMLDDGFGNVWMHGNRSVHRASWTQLTDLLAGRSARVHGVVYERRDGLRTPETTGQTGVAGLPGQLWFPTIEGPALLDARRALALDSVAPRVEIVGLIAEGFGAQPLRDGMRLPRGARRVSVRFAALGVPRMHGVRYTYRIDDLDREWIGADDAGQAVYSDLPPGRHQLRVRASNEAGIVSDGDALLTFEVPAYFHETRWFIGLVLLATAVLLILGLQARERQLTERARLLQEAVRDRTTHLQVALDTVERQANRLRALDETRSRILANVSHEFRTPLSLIIGPVDDLLTTPGVSADATARQRLGVVARNAQRLRELVEQLLDAARLDAGTMPITLDVHDLVPQLRHLTESYASLAERRHIRFVLSCPVGGLRVRCDPDHIEKIVGNLVGNALKFTPEGGDVELRASRVFHEGSYHVRLEVQDNGRGIAPMDHDAIFERFRQLDDSMQRAESGTGIGLALVKELVELHGGTVRVESALGAGSTFIVLLPAEATDVHAVPSDARPPSSTARSASSSAGAGPLAPPTVPRVPEAERPTVLLVEDNAELREWLRDHLARRYRVREAANGADALAMARNEPPDIIVSDVMMPIMDGLALCAAVRAEPTLDVVPIVLLTARASRDSRVSGLRDGADDYVAKPVDLEELFVRLDNLVSARRRVTARFADVRLPAISVPLARPPRDDEDQRLLNALTVALAEHLDDEHFTADALAQSLGLSRSAMYRRLQPLLGRSPIDAVWEYRLLQAAQWLAETDITVSEIAYGVGFKTVPHFSARFRERFEETPSQYRAARANGKGQT